jgi:polyhydroxyalkanoate synthesis regulator phasin
MPSSERVDEMIAEGSITAEQAAPLMKEALARERVIWIADRIHGISRSVRDHEVSATEKRHLRAEYKSLRKESRLLKKQLWES